MALTLHYHPLSSYCHKVQIALYELDLPFERHLLDLGDPAVREGFLALWPTGKMPLLVDGDRVVPETSIIIEHLDRRHRLLPADRDACREVRLWDRLFDLYVMTPMQAIVADRMRPEAERDATGVTAARRTLAAYFERLLQRPSVARVLEEAKPFFCFYPYREALPARFLPAAAGTVTSSAAPATAPSPPSPA